jgi:hypothetical protein
MHEFVVILIICAVVGLVLHLAGGGVSHRRYYREHGLHPDLYYTYGRGLWGSINIFGFRIGHRIRPLHALASLAVTVCAVAVVIDVAARHVHHV